MNIKFIKGLAFIFLINKNDNNTYKMDDINVFNCFNKICFNSHNYTYLNICPETDEKFLNNSMILGKYLINKQNDLVYNLNNGEVIQGNSINNLIKVDQFDDKNIKIINNKCPLIKKVYKGIFNDIILIGNSIELLNLAENIRKDFENPIIIYTELTNDIIDKYRNNLYFEKNKIIINSNIDYKYIKKWKSDFKKEDIKTSTIFEFNLKDKDFIDKEGIKFLKYGLTEEIFNKISPYLKFKDNSLLKAEDTSNHAFMTKINNMYSFDINKSFLKNIYVGSYFNPYLNIFNKKELVEEYYNNIKSNIPNSFIPKYKLNLKNENIYFTGFLGYHDKLLKSNSNEIFFFKNDIMIGYLTNSNDLKNLIIYNSLRTNKIIKFQDFKDNQINNNLYNSLKKEFIDESNNNNYVNFESRFSEEDINETIINI